MHADRWQVGARRSAGLAALKAWDEKHKDAIVYMGGPLGPTKRTSADGVADVVNELTVFVVVCAPSHQAAAEMFEGHPHFTIFPCDSVDVIPRARSLRRSEDDVSTGRVPDRLDSAQEVVALPVAHREGGVDALRELIGEIETRLRREHGLTRLRGAGRDGDVVALRAQRIDRARTAAEEGDRVQETAEPGIRPGPIELEPEGLPDPTRDESLLQPDLDDRLVVLGHRRAREVEQRAAEGVLQVKRDSGRGRLVDDLTRRVAAGQLPWGNAAFDADPVLWIATIQYRGLRIVVLRLGGSGERERHERRQTYRCHTPTGAKGLHACPLLSVSSKPLLGMRYLSGSGGLPAAHDVPAEWQADRRNERVLRR